MSDTVFRRVSEVRRAIFTPVVVDGTLYILVAVLAFMSAILSSDDSAKWVEPKTLFWCKFWVGSASAGALALKMFRSTQFADSKKDDTDVPIKKVNSV